MSNRQDGRSASGAFLATLERCGTAALGHVGKRGLALAEPPERIEAVLVDDAEITRIHGEFLDDPSATDVITFDYGVSGEIVISVETAERQSAEFGTEFEREVALYLIHGILHLCGYEDAVEEERNRMSRLQEELLEASFPVG